MIQPLDILIPLGIGSKWDNNEIKYCLKSLERHMKIPYTVHIYANKEIDLPNVTVIERPESQDYENYYDTLNKLKIFSNVTLSDRFLYLYDDNLLLQDITDIKQLINPYLEIDNKTKYDLRKRTKHGKTINRAFDMMYWKQDIWYSFETHTPRMYTTENVREIFEKFPIGIPPYAFSTLYFNYNIDEALIEPIGNYKAGFVFDDLPPSCFIPQNSQDIDKIVSESVWMNYNDKGLNAKNGLLKNWIEKKWRYTTDN